MRVEAADAETAEALIRNTLQRGEVEPNGSLQPDFRLEPAEIAQGERA